MIYNKNFFLDIKFLFFAALSFRFLFICSYYFFEFDRIIGPDSRGMHDYSVFLYQNNIIEKEFMIYYFFSKIYSFFSIKSYIAGCLIAVFFWCLSFYLLYKIIKLFNLNKNIQSIIILIFCFWPSLLIFSTTFNKEVFQTFFLLLHLYFIIKLLLNKKIKYIFFSLFSIAMLTIFHKALFFPSLFISFYALFFYLVLIKKIKIKFLFIIILVLLLLFYFFNSFISLTYSQLSHGVPVAISKYQNGVLYVDLRANMRNFPISLKDYYDFSIFFFKAILDYFLSPYISYIMTFSDLVALLENLFRVIIILLIFHSIYFNTVNFNKFTFVSFLFFLAIEIIWAMGTTNWGTAIRHHSVALPILLISLAIAYRKKKIFS